MSNILGLTEQEMEATHERWHAENPAAARSQCLQCKQKRRREDDRAAKFVSALVREGATPPVTIQELAHAVERRPSWIRRILHEAELTAPEAVREPLLPRSKRPCARCGHLRHCHCSGRKPRLHVQHTLRIGTFPCPMTPHCKGTNEVAPGQFTNCSCDHFTTTVERPKKMASFAAAAAIPHGLVQDGSGVL